MRSLGSNPGRLVTQGVKGHEICSRRSRTDLSVRREVEAPESEPTLKQALSRDTDQKCCRPSDDNRNESDPAA